MKMPVAMTRDQVATLNVVSYLDVARWDRDVRDRSGLFLLVAPAYGAACGGRSAVAPTAREMAEA